MRDPLAVMRLADRPLGVIARPGAKQRFALCGLGASALLAMGFLTAGLPVISMCVLAVAGVSSFVLGSAGEIAADVREHGRPRFVPPDEIASADARALYCAILLGFAEVERALAAAPRLTAAMAPVSDRCRTAVALSGRIALLANPIQRYLDEHDAGAIRSALDRLRVHAEAARDGATVGALHHAVATRARQLVILEQIIARRDRIFARLELVHAALDTFAATIVKLHTVEEEQVVLAGESVADQLDDIGGDLEVLEAALEPEHAA